MTPSAEGFRYLGGVLAADGVDVRDAAQRFGTPLYLYSAASFRSAFQSLHAAFAPLDPLICFSVKSCSNLHVLSLLAAEGSGFDVVSGGEIRRVLEAGGRADRTVFAGVGKTEAEIEAGIRADILLFNIESEDELAKVSEVGAKFGRRVPVALRVNPHVDTGTHPYVATGERSTKFGVDPERAPAVLDRAARAPGVEVAGLHAHIGSQIALAAPFERSAALLVEMAAAACARGIPLRWLDIGGGIGIPYRGGEAPDIRAISSPLVLRLRGRGFGVIIEPGRYISGGSGILLTRVLYRKEAGGRRFVIVDAGMTDLIRPALYGSYHWIWPVLSDRDPRVAPPAPGEFPACDVVGPICESADFLGEDRPLPDVRPGDLLAVFTAGAYGFSMASTYNSRPRPAEVLVDGGALRLVRRRETYDDLVRAERDLDAP